MKNTDLFKNVINTKRLNELNTKQLKRILKILDKVK